MKNSTKNTKKNHIKKITASRYSLLIGVLVFAIIGGGLFSVATNNRSSVNITQAASACSVDDNLVNSCRPWIGAAVGSYSMAGANNDSVQFPFFEKRLNNPNVLIDPSEPTSINKELDVMHTYHINDRTSFNSTELQHINRENGFLFINYRPDTVAWSNANGSNATVNTRIDNLANSVKAVSPKKVMISITAEPEDEVNAGTFACAKPNSLNLGTAAEYVQMWRTVRQRFDAIGATNVVWNMNYMGYSGFDCMVSALWPGNEYVDWVTWDPYTGGLQQSFDSEIGRFYDLLLASSNSTNDYLSKTWGISEFGYWNQTGNSTDEQALVYWQQAKTAIETNKFPRIKMYSVFDTGNNEDLTFSSMIGMKFAPDNNPYQVIPYIEEQTAYNAFADAIFSREASATPADINNDGKVDIVDLSILLSNWGSTSSTSDINNDSKVDIVDLSILLSAWG